MKPKLIVVVLGSLLALLGVSLATDTKPVKIMKVSEIKIGMKGYGKTVFEGTRIDKFEVEVLGVMKNAIGPKLDMILIRCQHRITDKAGIIAGMSGSPIYIVDDPVNEPEGKLIGALSYGWEGMKEAIAGVTPIEEMLADMNRPPEKTGYNDEPNIYPEPPKLAKVDITAPVAGTLVPLQTPLFISGMNAQRLKQLAKYLEPYNLMPVQAGSPSSDLKGRVPKDLEPGSAIGVTMVRGDADWAGIGTVTYREGDRFLAFGHRNELKGEWSLPATNAYIYTIMPLVGSSFKMGSAVDTLGVMNQDRRTSISGVLGKSIGMMPMKISIGNVRTKTRHEFNYEVVNHRDVISGVLPWLMLSAADVETSPEPSTVEVITMMKLKGADPVSFRRLVTGSVSDAGCGSMNNIFIPIVKNPYKDVEVESVSFDVRVLNENRSGQILKVWTEQEEVEPGETVTVNVQIKPHLKEPVIQKMQITIPNDMAPQDINIAIVGGNAVAPELPPPVNAQEMIAYSQSFYPSDSLVAVIPLAETDVRMSGQNLPHLPNSVISQFINQTNEPIISSNDASVPVSPSLNKPVLLARKSLRFMEGTDFVIEGGGSVKVKVVRHKIKH